MDTRVVAELSIGLGWLMQVVVKVQRIFIGNGDFLVDLAYVKNGKFGIVHELL